MSKDDPEKFQWLDEQGSWCSAHANSTLPSYRETVDGWKPGQWDDVRRLTVDEAMQWPTIKEVVLPDSIFFARAFTTMDAALWEYELHLIYGLYMYYFWILVVAIGVGTRLLCAIGNLIARPSKYHPIDQLDADSTFKARSIFAHPQACLRRYLTVPAAFGNRCSRPLGWCTIPPRIQSLTIFLFVLFNIILCSCSYRLTEGNLYWPEKSKQLLRYASDRTGIISLVNFPLVWLFGMRNDFLMWITGWGFGTYNAFHRWVARVATVQAGIHSIGYTWMIMESGGWPEFGKYWTKHYFWNGELATIAMCALLAFSFYGIRRAHYEIFLVTHIVLSIVALWTMYYHVEIFVSGEWNVFIWPCLAIWIFDRFARLGRVFMFNRNPFSTFGTASYDTKSNLVRLDVDGSKNMVTPKPGTYYYIHLLDSILYAHQSHPFTLAYVSSDTSDFQSTPLSPISSRNAPSRTASPVSVDSNESDALLEPSGSAAASNLVFLIRPYDGFTARIRDICMSRPAKVRVLVEGPYGHHVPLHRFPNVLFVVGGTGIAVPLSHLHRILQADSHVQSVKIVWAVREHAFLESVLQEFSGMLGDERLELEVHVTRADQVHDEVLGESTKRVRVVTHRPNVSGAVEASVKVAGQTGLAVVACGPALMADQARMAAVDMLKKGHTGVEYFEESFKW